MKLLAFTDTHGSIKSLGRIKEKIKAEKPEAVVCAGDISQFENGITKILKTINDFEKPVFIIHGNHESEATFKNINAKFKNIFYIHHSGCVFDNCLFVGYGGGGFSVEDNGFKRISKNLESVLKRDNSKKTILVSHMPPYKTKLDKINGSYSGSKPLRLFIERHKIELAVCGHIHENFGTEDFIGKTKIANPGPNGAIFDI